MGKRTDAELNLSIGIKLEYALNSIRVGLPDGVTWDEFEQMRPDVRRKFIRAIPPKFDDDEQAFLDRNQDEIAAAAAEFATLPPRLQRVMVNALPRLSTTGDA